MAIPPATMSRLTNRVAASEAPGLSGLLGLAVGVVIIAALSVAREVLIPITLAVLLSFVLGPVVAILRRVGMPRALSVMIAVASALTVVAVIGVLI
ncbi:MAG: AI-2E family transporter, partial [Pseudomonadota bacterium]|nr:AI-2E family transporter [Pseudomonadota bacterium]